MPVLSRHYGMNGDEDIEILYGKDVYKYFATGDKQALDYNNHELGGHITGSEFYGSILPLVAETTHQWFGTNRVNTRHFYISLFGAAMMICTGLLAYRMSNRNWLTGILALLFMIFCPRIFGESMENGKDIPFASGMIIGICFFYFLLQAFKEKSNKIILYAIGMALGTAFAFGSRPGGALMQIGVYGMITLITLISDQEFRNTVWKSKTRNKFLAFLIGAVLIGYAIAVATWPYAHSNPVSNLFSAMEEMANRDVSFRVFFEGKYYNTKDMPSYYSVKWIFISNSILVLMAFIGFVLLSFKMIRKYGWAPVILILFMAIFPVFYIVYKKSTIFDTWRHLFFIFPFWATGAALFFHYISSVVKKESYQWIPYAVALLGLLPEICWTLTTTPYQHVYFNQFVGGIAGANGRYDLDYYQTSNREMAQWLIKNAEKKPDGSKIKVLSNMEGLYNVDDLYYEGYIEDQKAWIDGRYARYYERYTKDWDYYVTYNRFLSEWQLENKKFPPCDAVYEVKVKGVTIGAILHRSTNDAFLAFEAFQAKDFPKAVLHYEKAMQNGPLCDENELFYYGIALVQSGNIDKGIGEILKATQLDGGREDFYAALSQIYMIKGDKANGERAARTAQSIKSQRLQQSQ